MGDEEMQKKCKSLMLKVQMMKAKEMCMSEEKDERMQKMCEMDEEDEDDEEDKVDREMLGVQMRACKQEAMKDDKDCMEFRKMWGAMCEKEDMKECSLSINVLKLFF